MKIFLNPELQEKFNHETAFDEIMQLQGKVYRAVEARKTLSFTHKNKTYFVKLHFGAGWKEIFKNLLTLRIPVLGAETEYRAIKRLEQLNIATMKIAGFGKRGCNPAKQQSFLITDELKNVISLQDFSQHWLEKPPTFALKKHLISLLAQLLRHMHTHGVNHRDCYLVHIMVDADARMPEKLYVMDLHRAQLRKKTPQRWLIKDVAGIYFSSMHLHLTQRDCFRFMKEYDNLPLCELLKQHRFFWNTVKRRGQRQYERFTKD